MVLNYVRNEVLQTPFILTFNFDGSLHNNKQSTFEKLRKKLAKKFRSELISYTQGGVRNVRNFFPYEIF